MTAFPATPSPAAPWHALLAPLPADAVPVRQPVAPPEILSTPQGAAIAGWQQLTIHLSAGAAGLRNVLVVLDAGGRPISASDTVLYRCEDAPDEPARGDNAGAKPAVTFLQESVGGRFEEDGSFTGTRWRSLSVDSAEQDDAQITSVPSPPSALDAAAITALVAEVMRRAESA